ncbi:MAG: acetamidase/formamidase family protein [Deltaproteobacteria bacterium]|nr:acetamidase/formamidase family protein [Deltaproteobacteria bacterium]
MVKVDEFIDLIGPDAEMLGPVRDGGLIVTGTEPACYGPMITPEIESGHTISRPVAVAGAEVGDGVALKIKEIKITSRAAASGTETPREGSFVGDPFVAKKCPGCGKVNPHTVVKGIGKDAIHCLDCDTPVSAFEVTNGFTMIFDDDHTVGLTVPGKLAEEIARNAEAYSGAPAGATCHSVLVFALADMPAGIVTRVRPMIGNFGTLPAVTMPSSHNAGDFGVFLIGAPHKHAISERDLLKRTDAHMDIDSVRQGAIVIAPVKVEGAGIVVGDVHAMQGDGEIAGHTTDVSAEVTVEVEVVKGLANDGPIILPLLEDLPPLARFFSTAELERARSLGRSNGFEIQAEVAPIQVVGSGANLNEATMNGLERLAAIVQMDIEEVKNRVTITGGIEIGRLPGIVHISMLTPMSRLEEIGIAHLARNQYGL